MRILGLDLGTRTMGIALSNPSQTLASMKETYRFADRDFDAAFAYICTYIEQYAIKEVALGLPLHMNGSYGDSAAYCLSFKERLESLGLEVVMIDERLTSVMANKLSAFLNNSAAKRKAKVDQMAAVEILQTYLDQKRSKHG